MQNPIEHITIPQGSKDARRLFPRLRADVEADGTVKRPAMVPIGYTQARTQKRAQNILDYIPPLD